MPLSWNEIKSRAIQFSKEWETETRERAEKDSFWNDFFKVFGISRRRVASFEESVKRLNDKQGYIDLFWSGTLLIEHKSKGKNLDKAYDQALSYFHGLKEHELPKYVLVSDFSTFILYDLDTKDRHEFSLSEFVGHVHLFGFIAGYEKRTYKDEDPVNIEAAYLMGQLHDNLEGIGYSGHVLEVYLVRLLFCLFADDTGIFERGIFQEYIDLHTKDDGSDLAMHIAQIFQVLNTPRANRLSNLDDSLNAFPYVNGQLFEEVLPFASFDSGMRETLLNTGKLDWGKISPAIFGSMFQAAMNQQERRNLGAHYTSEKNIQKVIKPLFLDELYQDFEKAKASQPKLIEFQKKLANLKFLDPACGSGNFLIITYRELRQLEIEVLKEIFFVKQKQRKEVMADAGIKLDLFIKVNVDQFYGIEYDEFAARIAGVAMWLIDHQMNMKVSEEFGQYFVRLPLNKSATILHGNALRIDWESVVPKNELNYILGNPPFIGSKWLSKEQREDMKILCSNVPKYGVLDYVTGWHIKATNYIDTGSKIKTAFVSTNSITQGQQVSPLWSYLLNQGVKIDFAYRTFVWSNEAKGKAAVHCVIIGFSKTDNNQRLIYDEENGQITEIKAKNINPYLIDANNILIPDRSKPLCDVPKIATGNKPIDGGNYIFDEEQLKEFLLIEPQAKDYIFPFLGGSEFIRNKKRYILYLKGISPTILKELPEVYKRINLVKAYRESSKSKPTQKIASTPTLYHTENVPNSQFLVIPEVSSMRRKYVPIGFLKPILICSNKLRILPNATLYDFGLLTSQMHMAWMRTVTGRLKSDFQYSVSVVYNNYPFPKEVSDKNKTKVEKAAQTVLDTRAKYPDSSLADLYDPLTMPPDLVKAHQKLDKAVDLCYRPQPFTNERNRIEFLFELYEEYTKPLLKGMKK